MPGNIGKSSTGANSALTADNWQNECIVGSSFRYTASAGETVTSIHVFGDGTGTAEVGVYVWNGSVPTTKVGSANITIGATAGDYSTTVSWALSAGVTYVVGIDYQVGISADWNIRYDTGQGAGATSISASTGALASTWAQSTTSTDASTVWAVVEAGGDSEAVSPVDNVGITDSANVQNVAPNYQIRFAYEVRID